MSKLTVSFSTNYFFSNQMTNLLVGTINIDKNSQNGEFQEKLDRNVIHAQIRNIFDIEFNKKFQGSIQVPLKV